MNIPKPLIVKDVIRWLEEDIPFGDISIAGEEYNKSARATIIAKQNGVVCGTSVAKAVFEQCNVTCKIKIADGQTVNASDIVIEVDGKAEDILMAERTALNILGHLSGIATRTRQLTDMLKSEGLNTKVAATRKTLPGLRKYQKYAVTVGGGDTHRLNLSDMVMLKENHLMEFDNLETALRQTAQRISFSKKIEIEVTNEAQALVAAKSGLAHIIMLDNFKPEEAKSLVPRLKQINPNILLEISGGITPDNLLDYAKSGVDIVSMGFLTHSVKNFDYSLLISD